MQLTSIKATNLKGRTFEHGLQPFTVVAGPNDAGKSALCDAVRLVLLGHLPELGKSNTATFDLASGSKMSVAAVLADGKTVARAWEKKKKSVTATAPEVELPETPLVMLNAAEYFGKSDKARVEMLFSVLRLDPRAFSRGAVIEKLKAAVKEHGELADIDDLTTHENAETLEEWLTLVGEALESAQSEARQAAKRFEGTVQGIVQLRANDPLVDAEALTVELTKLRAEIGQAQNRLGALREQAKGAEANDEKRRALIAAIERARARVGDRPTTPIDALQREIDATNTRVGELRAEYAAARARYNEIEGKRARARILEGKIREALNVPTAEASTVSKLETEIAKVPAYDTSAANKAANEAQSRVAGLQERQRGNDAARQRAEAWYQSHASGDKCPTCGAAGDEFHGLIKNTFDARIGELDAEQRAIESEYQDANEAAQRAQAAQNEALKHERTAQRLRRELDAAKLALEKYNAAAAVIRSTREELDRLGDLEAVAPEPPKEIEQLNARLQGLNAERERTEAAAELARGEEALQQIPEAVGNPDEAAYGIECQIQAKQERVEEIEQGLKKHGAQLADERTMEDARQSQEKELTRELLLKAARAKLQEERERIINEAFKPLLEKVNTFTAGILPSPLEFREGELGRYNGPSWVPVRAFGGAYTAVTYAGIQAALGEQAPAKIVIVDEMGRLDATTKAAFLANIKRALERGSIEQFIGVDVDPDFYMTPAGPEPRKVRFDGLHLIEAKR